MELIIEEARPEEITELAALIAGDEAWGRYGIDREEAVRLLREAPETLYAARLNGRLVGFDALKLDGVGNFGAYLRMIIVDQSYRNRGIGSRILDHAWGLAVKRVPNLFLICSQDNTGAQRFYERNGFKAVGLLDNLVMAGHREILYRRTSGPLRLSAEREVSA